MPSHSAHSLALKGTLRTIWGDHSSVPDTVATERQPVDVACTGGDRAQRRRLRRIRGSRRGLPAARGGDGLGYHSLFAHAGLHQNLSPLVRLSHPARYLPLPDRERPILPFVRGRAFAKLPCKQRQATKPLYYVAVCYATLRCLCCCAEAAKPAPALCASSTVWWISNICRWRGMGQATGDSLFTQDCDKHVLFWAHQSRLRLALPVALRRLLPP